MADKFDIIPVLEHYGVRVPYRGGGYVKVCCPIHDESRPSASVRDNSLHCFGCGWHGDAVDLIQEKESNSYADAVRIAQEISGPGSSQLSAEPPPGGWFPGRSKNSSRVGRGVSSWRGWDT